MNKEVRSIGYFLRLDQNWGMFASCVIKANGRYIQEGTLADGNKIDLWQDGKRLTLKNRKVLLGSVQTIVGENMERI